MIVKENSCDYFAKKEAGGKGYNLYMLSQFGINVPRWVVIGRSVFQQFLTENGIASKLDDYIAEYQSQGRSAEYLSAQVGKLINSTALSTNTIRLVSQSFDYVALDGLISVRSSAADEDGAAHSFAGQMSSFLYVANADDAACYLKQCWASAFSTRAIRYRHDNGLALTNISIAVIFQEMIDADVSGVLFTRDPTNDDTHPLVISSVYGAGEGIVSGALDSDTFWLHQESGVLLRQEIVDKPKMLTRGDSGHCIEKTVSPSQRGCSSLTTVEIQKLFSVGKQLANYYSFEQDIEWVINLGEIYILQSRPITTLTTQTRGYPNLWDNSNIVESYGGITLPLSFSFALENYKNVYIQFCEILSVPHRVVKDMEHYLSYMLGCIDGRVYYNLYNWYKLVGVLPGFKQNKQFMETMMGVGQTLSEEIQKRIEPHPSWNSFIGKLRKAMTGFRFIMYHFFIQNMVDKFISDFDQDYQIFRKKDFARMHSDELMQNYIEINRRFLRKWKAPIINDFLCMVHFGIFSKLSTKWLSIYNENIQNDLLSGEGDLESTEPTKALIRFAAYVTKNAELKKIILDNNDFELMELINQSKFTDFYEMIKNYIDRFGYRCISEMKLEEEDLLSNPSFIFICLKNYIRSDKVDLAAYEDRETKLRKTAEEIVNRNLSGWRKLIYHWSLKHARKSVRNRENTRFARTRIYGVVRHLFIEMGARLCHMGVVSSATDIFYLNLQELYGIHQGTLTGTNLQSVVAIRKQDYAGFEEHEPKTRFQTRGVVYWNNDYLAQPEQPQREAGAEYDLSGIACCPGVVEGKVRIIHSIKDNLNLNGEILVASRTDPGWVPIFPTISGLLVERGSMLSHSAIIAREMGIPAVVGITGLLNTLEDGMHIRMDGKAGTIKIIENVS